MGQMRYNRIPCHEDTTMKERRMVPAKTRSLIWRIPEQLNKDYNMTYQSQKDADLSAALVAWTRPVDGRGESWGGFGGGVGGAAVTSCFVRFISVLASECAYICALRHLLFLLCSGCCYVLIGFAVTSLHVTSSFCCGVAAGLLSRHVLWMLLRCHGDCCCVTCSFCCPQDVATSW